MKVLENLYKQGNLFKAGGFNNNIFKSISVIASDTRRTFLNNGIL